jgi:hypothetical protein
LPAAERFLAGRMAKSDEIRYFFEQSEENTYFFIDFVL